MLASDAKAAALKDSRGDEQQEGEHEQNAPRPYALRLDLIRVDSEWNDEHLGEEHAHAGPHCRSNEHADEAGKEPPAIVLVLHGHQALHYLLRCFFRVLLLFRLPSFLFIRSGAESRSS
eukprot:scaffold2796_cov31-Tisochrysis_lutea.AAC.2